VLRFGHTSGIVEGVDDALKIDGEQAPAADDGIGTEAEHLVGFSMFGS